MTPQEQIQSILAKEARKAGMTGKDFLELQTLLEVSSIDLLLSKIITQDSHTQKLKDRVKILAKSNLNVLILGETGTGKELIAQSLHNNRIGQMISINCGGVVDTLLEAEFFGASRGAYTGCDRDRQGYFEQAQGGTIFLDEISELPYLLQCKLLRVVENKKVRRVGDNKEIIVDCRIVSASNNLDLKTRLGRQKSSFREDLYFRLAGTTLETKPLRERVGDINLIIKHLDKNNIIEESIINEWLNLPFEGNIRELINLINEYLELKNIL